MCSSDEWSFGYGQEAFEQDALTYENHVFWTKARIAYEALYENQILD